MKPLTPPTSRPNLEPLVIPSPGEPGGPCFPTCEHHVCAHLHVIAETALCGVCGKPIGFDTPYWPVPAAPGVTYIHERCARPR